MHNQVLFVIVVVFNLLFALFLFLFTSHYFKKNCQWTRSMTAGVHGPGPLKWSMDPVQDGGPWTPGPCFVLTHFHYLSCVTEH